MASKRTSRSSVLFVAVVSVAGLLAYALSSPLSAAPEERIPPSSVDNPMSANVHCEPLPPPTGPTVTVFTEAELRYQAFNAAPATNILIASGIYHLQDLVYVVNDGIVLRGQTGDRDDVILDFGGMNDGRFGVLVEADDVTIADLTIRNAHDHGVAIQGSDRPLLYNLRIQDIRDQLVKVNPAGNGSEDGLLACSRLEYTTSAPDNYTNGISAHNAHRWVVRDNEWYRIRTISNDPVPTILFWSGSSDTVVERNLLVDCYQGIAFGNSSHGSGDHTGGVVRNNMIYASMPHDVVVEMVHATGWLVANNTALLLDPDGVTWGMEARFPDTQGTFAYNLTNMGVINRDGARATLNSNVTVATPSWFVNPGIGDLHLQDTAVGAIDQAGPLAQVPDDYDGDARPIGPAPDVGADEYGGSPTPATPTPSPTSPPAEQQAVVFLPLITKNEPATTPLPQPTTQPPPPVGSRIQPADLAYQGAFRLPAVPGDYEFSWHWGGAAMAYYPDGDPPGPADGYPGSLFGTGHDWNQWVSEVSIPVPLISVDKDVNDLNTATTLQQFQDIRRGLFDHLDFEIPRVGLAYLPKQGVQTAGKLHFCWGQHMQEGETGVSHGWCELDLSDPQTAGAWRLGGYWNYVTNDYLFEIPMAWADAHTPGMYLATGRFRDGGQGGLGPSLFAYGPWNEGNPPPPGATLPAVPLLLYGNAYTPNAPSMDNYHHSDEWSGGAWLTADDRSAVVFVGTKGQGDCWYGNPEGPCLDCEDRGWWSTQFEGQMIFYDPADLAAVANGEMETWEPQPYATLSLDPYLYHIESSQQKYHLGAASFDRLRGVLYVFEVLADDDKPLVHVWQVDG